MQEGKPTSEIVCETEKPIERFTKREKFEDWLLWWEPSEEKNGFEFVVLQWCSASGPDYDAPENQSYEKAMQGYGFFDGIRHIRFFPDSECGSGYSYYPKVKLISQILMRLDEIEKEHCWDAE